MAKGKAKQKQLPPIDLSSGEWIVFDWRNSIVRRNMQLGVAHADCLTELMPVRFSLPGCRIIRTDTNTQVEQPISYSHSPMVRLVFFDPFWGSEIVACVKCEVIPNPYA